MGQPTLAVRGVLQHLVFSLTVQGHKEVTGAVAADQLLAVGNPQLGEVGIWHPDLGSGCGACTESAWVREMA